MRQARVQTEVEKMRRTSLVTALLLITLCLLHGLALAQSGHGSLSGLAQDSAGAVLHGAKVELLPTTSTATTNERGEFVFTSVAPGTYTLVVNYVGFAQYTQEVTIAPGKSTHVKAVISVNSKNEEVTVYSERESGEVEAINRTRTADNLIQSLPAEVITSLPNANVADALGRLPSVTLLRIEGEGVYVSVRGTEPRLTNTMVDGITIASPEPNVRQVRLDVIASDLVESVEINKTLSANQDGDGIGGSVNLRTKTATDQPLLTISGNGGYNPILNGRYNGQINGTYGQRFGKHKRFGLLFGGTWDWNGRGIDNIQPALDPNSTFAQPFYDNNTIREYRYYRTRYGFAGSADYKLGEFSSIYGHGMYSDLKDWGDKWYYSPVSTAIKLVNGTPTLPSPTAASGSPKFYTSSKRPNASVSNLVIGGHHVQSQSWFNWEVSGAQSYEIDSAGNPKADFSWVGPKVYCNYVPQGVTNYPTFGNCDGASSPLLNAALWAFKDITTSKGRTGQLNLGASASYARRYQVGSHPGVIEAGFKIRNDHKYQDATETVYDSWSTTGNANLLMQNLQGSFVNKDYYFGRYFGGSFGPVSDFNKVQAYTMQYLGGYVNGYKTAANTWPNVFHTVERITAGYVMNTIDLGKLHVQTGVRFENTQMDTLGYNVTLYLASTKNSPCPTGTGCGIPSAVTNNPQYLDVLPSVQLRYALTKNDQLRLVAARGIARPDAYQLVPYVTEDASASPVTVSIGNPALRPEHANNFDLLYERFLRPAGMLQAGFFFKQLSAPQVGTTIPGSVSLSSLPSGYLPPALAPVIAQYPGDSVSMTVNGKNAYLYGFEVSYQQHLTFLPGALKGLGLSANYSLMDSSEKGLLLRTDSPALPQQSNVAWNVSPTYDNKRVSFRLGMTYNGPCVYQYSYVSPKLVTGADPSGLGPKGPSGDIHTLPHMQIDAQISYKLGKHFSAMAYGLNLNNEVFGYYTGSTNFVNQREYYKATYAGGLKYTFSSER